VIFYFGGWKAAKGDFLGPIKRRFGEFTAAPHLQPPGMIGSGFIFIKKLLKKRSGQWLCSGVGGLKKTVGLDTINLNVIKFCFIKVSVPIFRS
jgi:hypothetical protein